MFNKAKHMLNIYSQINMCLALLLAIFVLLKKKIYLEKNNS